MSIKDLHPDDRGCAYFIFYIIIPLWLMVLLTVLVAHLMAKY